METKYLYINLDRDLRELPPAQSACLAAGFLQENLCRLQIVATDDLHDIAEIEDPQQDGIAPAIIERAIYCLQKLAAALNTSGVESALREVHNDSARQIKFRGEAYGSYCVAVEAIGREYYTSILKTVDREGYCHWLTKDGSASTYQEISKKQIATQWTAIRESIAQLPRTDFDELKLAIENEWMELRGAVFAKPIPSEPLTDQQQEAFDYIRDSGPKSGKEVCTALGIESESTFTRHYVPALKLHGIRNRRGAGYYLPNSP